MKGLSLHLRVQIESVLRGKLGSVIIGCWISKQNGKPLSFSGGNIVLEKDTLFLAGRQRLYSSPGISPVFIFLLCPAKELLTRAGRKIFLISGSKCMYNQ